MAGAQDLSRAICATNSPPTEADTERAYKIVSAHARPAAVEFGRQPVSGPTTGQQNPSADAPRSAAAR
jgi:hypothetical protein